MAKTIGPDGIMRDLKPSTLPPGSTVASPGEALLQSLSNQNAAGLQELIKQFDEQTDRWRQLHEDVLKATPNKQ